MFTWSFQFLKKQTILPDLILAPFKSFIWAESRNNLWFSLLRTHFWLWLSLRETATKNRHHLMRSRVFVTVRRGKLVCWQLSERLELLENFSPTPSLSVSAPESVAWCRNFIDFRWPRALFSSPPSVTPAINPSGTNAILCYLLSALLSPLFDLVIKRRRSTWEVRARANVSFQWNQTGTSEASVGSEFLSVNPNRCLTDPRRSQHHGNSIRSLSRHWTVSTESKRDESELILEKKRASFGFVVFKFAFEKGRPRGYRRRTGGACAATRGERES